MIGAFDDILVQLGIGKWNVMYFVSASYALFLLVPNTLPGPFLSPPLGHTCREPAPLSRREPAFNGTQRDDCMVEIVTGEGQLTTTKCTTWDYDNSTFTSTLTSEFGLVCDRAFLRVVFQSIETLGNVIGEPSSGFISDSFGRRWPTTLCVILGVLVTLASCWLTSLPAIFVARFFIGIIAPFSYNGLYTIAMEVCEPKKRSVVGILMALPWAIGVMMWGGAGYLIRDWRRLLLFCTLPGILLFPVTMFMDESPRWLIVKGRHREALVVLKKAARWNGAILPENEVLLKHMEDIRLQSQEDTDLSTNQGGLLRSVLDSVLILFRTPKLRRITLVSYLCMVSCTVAYIGLTISGTVFEVNTFLFMVISGLMEIPAYTISVYFLSRFGRRRPVMVGYLIGTFSLLAIPFIPKDLSWLMVTLTMVGKLFISALYQIFYLYIAELFPTEVRMRGFGTTMFVASVSGIVIPYITDSLGSSYPWLPSCIFGLLTMSAGLATLLLPETHNRPLIETVASLENKKRRQSIESKACMESFELNTMKEETAEVLNPKETD